MKKTAAFVYFLTTIHAGIAQTLQFDSLKRVLASAKSDSQKVNLLVDLGYYNQDFQHSIDFANTALTLARKINYAKGEANALHQIGNQYVLVSNYPRALYYFLQALRIQERIDAGNDAATSNESIGYVYMQQGDYDRSLAYYRKAEAIYKGDLYRAAILYGKMAYLFRSLHKQDSALRYFQTSYEYFNEVPNKYQLNVTLNGMGNLQLAMGNKDLALSYYRAAVKNGNTYNDTAALSYTYFNIANYYHGEQRPDSCLMNAEKSLSLAQRANVLENVIRSGRLLSSLYAGKDYHQAWKYLQIAQVAKDSLYSTARRTDIQNMTFNEDRRESEIAEREHRESEERKQNIQYAAIALGIIVFIILFLLLSRTIIVNERWISFFATLGLLVVFEFINLFTHPWLATFTHESPFLMLCILVTIASLLVPLHHRLEHWTKEKMIEKNKAIRLAAAKKTIEKLEGGSASHQTS